jgi:iron(III) transport system ATP-binding protein
MRGIPPGPGQLAIRPQAFRLRDGEPKAAEIGARIGKVAYLGSHMEYGLALDGLAEEIFVIAGNVSNPHAAGDRVAVSIDPAGAALIPSPEKTDTP